MSTAKQNITLSFPEELLRQVKVIAAKRGTSVSALLTEKLEQIVLEADDYEQARRKAMALMDKGFELGTHGKITWTRDELHER